MADIHNVELITRRINLVSEGNAAEVVTAVMIDGHRLELPLGGLVQVTYDAGETTARVRLDILAGNVRYVDENHARA